MAVLVKMIARMVRRVIFLWLEEPGIFGDAKIFYRTMEQSCLKPKSDPHLGRKHERPCISIYEELITPKQVTFSLTVQFTTAPVSFVILSWTTAISTTIFRSHARSCGTFGGRRGIGPGYSPSISLFSVSIIPPVYNTHISFKCHRPQIVPAIDSIVKYISLSLSLTPTHTHKLSLKTWKFY
jgi:hypothetical protein